MKNKSVFVCSNCGFESAKWLGRCTDCGSWNTMVEEVKTEEKPNKHAVRTEGITYKPPQKMNEIEIADEDRFLTGLSEFDRVLGGGVVKGSLTLIGGDPGIGKSTLLLQICENIGKSRSILYVSGEESKRQLKLRAQRLSVTTESLSIMGETNINHVYKAVEDTKPEVLIVDSIQVMFNSDIVSAPGSVSQVRFCTNVLMKIAKEMGITVFLVGHVTKEGALAGPKVLEHMVDCVVYFEGDTYKTFRILRTVKNRFGSTNEIGVFEMRGTGLAEIMNPSELFLKDRPDNVSGTCVFCSMEGTRPILAEIQALVSHTGFGIPRRMASGIDYNRMVLQIAVLEKRLGLNLASSDIYVNVIGGIKIDEPAVDLAVSLAIASGFKNKVGDNQMAVFGEVGLAGELRGVTFAEQRINECKKLGFDKCLVPNENAKAFQDNPNVFGAKNLFDALNIYLKI